MTDNNLRIHEWRILGSMQAVVFVDKNSYPAMQLLIIDISYSMSSHATMMFKITENSDVVEFCLTDTRLTSIDIYNIECFSFTSKRTDFPKIGLSNFIYDTENMSSSSHTVEDLDPRTVTKEDIAKIIVAMFNDKISIRCESPLETQQLPTQIEIVPDYFNFQEYKWKAKIASPKGFCTFSSRLIEHNNDNNWYYIVSVGQQVGSEKYAVSVTQISDTYDAEIDSIPYAFSSHLRFQFKTWDELIRKLSETIVTKFVL